MKALITTLVISLGLSSTAAVANHSKILNGNEKYNMELISQVCKNIYETKEFNKLDKYIAKDFAFYKNFSQPLDYAGYKKHLMDIDSSCEKLNLLPFQNIMASGNKVAVQYTSRCTDASNVIHKKQIMAIAEMNNQHKISKIWIVTHEKE